LSNNLIEDNAPEEAEILKPLKQGVWGWPAVVNFVLGGTGAGMFIVGGLIGFFDKNLLNVVPYKDFGLYSACLAGVGLAAPGIEAGRPLRAIYLLSNLRTSWMSRETLLGILFVGFALADWHFRASLLGGLAAVAAVGFLISQGFVIFGARGVKSWNVGVIPLLFLTSGLVLGSGLLLLSASLNLSVLDETVLITAIAILVVNLWIWLVYLGRHLEGPFLEGRKLRRQVIVTLTVWVGSLMPIGCILLVFLFTEGPLGVVLQFLAGVGMLIGGLSRKATIVLWTGYLREIAVIRPEGGN
jgi:DMSO reductase anchor subunit